MRAAFFGPRSYYDGDPTPLKELSQDPGNSVFLAAELDKARLIRPYINAAIPVYATSQVFSGNTSTLTNYDLADVHFFDMPWMLQPDHPAVMIYPHVVPAMAPEMERLYALGIDSYRLLQVLFEHNPANVLPLGRCYWQGFAEWARVPARGNPCPHAPRAGSASG